MAKHRAHPGIVAAFLLIGAACSRGAKVQAPVAEESPVPASTLAETTGAEPPGSIDSPVAETTHVALASSPSPSIEATHDSAHARWIAAPEGKTRAPLLFGEWFNPMPGGLLSGYSADTGLDISGFQKTVYAVASGTIDYAEAGHTRWTDSGSTKYSVRLALDHPVSWKGHKITHVYYGHLYSLRFEHHEGDSPAIHVEGGQELGISGWANRSPHLHLGLLLDGHVEQDDWAYILDEKEIREALGSLQNGRKI